MHAARARCGAKPKLDERFLAGGSNVVGRHTHGTGDGSRRLAKKIIKIAHTHTGVHDAAQLSAAAISAPGVR